ncbi:MAG: T9SS type A sorting domain-containing protein [Bacteroidota bacterium]
MMRSLLTALAVLLLLAPASLAQPVIDGDLSDGDYRTLASKLNANAGFGPDIDVTDIRYFADFDNEVLYLGVQGKVNPFSSDGFGLYLNFDDPVGASAGTLLGDVAGAEFNYLGAADSAFTADFEVDYAFWASPGGTSTSVFFDAVTYVDSTRSDFLGTADQTGTAISGPADDSTNTGGPVFFNEITFAFDNSASGSTGLEFSIPFADLGIDAAQAGAIHAFAFVVSSTSYFSDVTVPGDVTAGNLGFDVDFNANLTDADCACPNPSSSIGNGPYNASAPLMPPTGPNFDLTASGVPSSVLPGGSFQVDFTVTNNTGNPVTGDLFYTASPGGIQFNVFNDQTVAAGATRSGFYTQNVPGNAVPGIYTYTVRIGNFPNATVDSEVFTIVVSASAPAAGGTAEWSASDAVWGGEEVIAAAGLATASVGAYPNPFASETTIQFETAKTASVRLAVYDVTGREVAVLVDGTVAAGTHQATFDARGLASGLYVWHLEAGGRAETGRITLVR